MLLFVCSGPEPGAPQAVIPRGGSAVHRRADPVASEHALSGSATHSAGCSSECSHSHQQESLPCHLPSTSQALNDVLSPALLASCSMQAHRECMYFSVDVCCCTRAHVLKAFYPTTKAILNVIEGSLRVDLL